MRKLYNEFFYIPKHGKIRETVMLVRVAVAVAIVIACLAAMSFTAYAYFSYNVTSGSNVIKAANFKTEVQVKITDGNGNVLDNGQITPITGDHKNFRIEGLEVGECYAVTITRTTNSTAKTGFVIVSADNCRDVYHTQQLGIDEKAVGGETEELFFKLKITDSTVVYLKAHWGTSSSYSDNSERYIENDDTVVFPVNEAATTTPSATESTTTQTQTAPTETTESGEPTTTTEPNNTTGEPTTQTAEPTVTETTTSTETAEDTTSTTEAAGTTTTEANE